jgi:hypothetical protein
MGGYLKPYGGRRKNGQAARGGLFFNGVVWRFLPGIVVGYFLNNFFAQNNSSRVRTASPPHILPNGDCGAACCA